MAGQPRSVLVLFGMGLRKFSMSPAFIPTIKALLASVTTAQAERYAAPRAPAQHQRGDPLVPDRPAARGLQHARDVRHRLTAALSRPLPRLAAMKRSTERPASPPCCSPIVAVGAGLRGDERRAPLAADAAGAVPLRRVSRGRRGGGRARPDDPRGGAPRRRVGRRNPSPRRRGQPRLPEGRGREDAAQAASRPRASRRSCVPGSTPAPSGTSATSRPRNRPARAACGRFGP